MVGRDSVEPDVVRNQPPRPAPQSVALPDAANNKTAASGRTECRRCKCLCPKLEREIQTASNHAEVVMRSVHDVPAEVAGHTDVTCHANLETAAKLPNQAAFILV